MADLSAGADQFAELARRLREEGEDGLRRELYDAITQAVRPVLRKIRAGLPDHMPERYAGVLAEDLKLETRKYLGEDPGVVVAATAPTNVRGRRKIGRVEDGILAHPVFGDRKEWRYNVAPEGGMSPDFFSGPLEDSAPEVQQAILSAMSDLIDKITRG